MLCPEAGPGHPISPPLTILSSSFHIFIRALLQFFQHSYPWPSFWSLSDHPSLQYFSHQSIPPAARCQSNASSSLPPYSPVSFSLRHHIHQSPFSPTIFNISSFVFLCVQLTFSIRLHNHISNASSFLYSSFLNVHVSEAYSAILHTQVFIIFFFIL